MADKVVESWYLTNTNPPHNKQYTVSIIIPEGKTTFDLVTAWGKIGAHQSSGLPCIGLTDLTSAKSHAKTIIDSKLSNGYKEIDHKEYKEEEMTPESEKKVEAKAEVKEEVKVKEWSDGWTNEEKKNGKQIDLDINDVNKIDIDAKMHIPDKSKEIYLDTGYLKPMVYGIKYNKPVLLVGDTGCGKTAAVRFLAGLTNTALRRVNLNGSTTVDEFVGKWRIDSGTMVWVDGVLVEAMRKGYWLLCDEINAVLPEIAFVLHSVLDDDQMVVLTQKDGEVLKAHKDFRFFGTMNPDYSGTHRLNPAFQDRFIVVEMDYPKDTEEVKILFQKTQIEDKDLLKKMVEVAEKCRTEFRQDKITTTFSTRKLLFWAEMCKVFPPAKAFKYAVLNKLPKDDVKPVMDIASIVFPGPEFRNILEFK